MFVRVEEAVFEGFSCVQSSLEKTALQTVDIFQKHGSLITVTALSALSYIPGFQLMSSVSMTVLSLGSAVSIIALDWNTASQFESAQNIIVLGAVTLGITGFFLRAPSLVIAAVSVDVLMRLGSLFSAVYERKEGESLTKFGPPLLALTADALVLSAVCVSCPYFLLVSTCTSASAFLTIMYETADTEAPWKAFCYAILAATCFVDASTILSKRFSIRNKEPVERAPSVESATLSSVIEKIQTCYKETSSAA